MQRVTVVRYTAKPGCANENETLARAVFADLRASPPSDIAYALMRNGDDFLHLFVNLAGDDASAVVELPSFKAFTEHGATRWTAPPEQQRHVLQLLEAFGFKGAMAPA